MLLFTGRKQRSALWLPLGEGRRDVAITGSWDDEDGQSALSIWDLEEDYEQVRSPSADRMLCEARHDGGVSALDTLAPESPAGGIQVLTASDSGHIAHYEIQSDPMGALTISRKWVTSGNAQRTGAATAVAAFPLQRDTLASTGEDGRLHVLSQASGQLVRVVCREEDALHCLVCSGAHTAVTGGASVKMWDARIHSSDASVTFGGSAVADLPETVTAVAFHPTAKLIASGTSAGTVSIFDERKPSAALWSEPLPARTAVWDVAFPLPAARNTLVTASGDGKLLQWVFVSSDNTAANFGTLLDVRVLTTRTLPISACAAHPSETKVCAIADDDSVEVVHYEA